MKKVHSKESQVRVIHGANEGKFSIVGSKVSHVAHKLRDVFNIPGDAVASIKGREVISCHILKEGDDLEFCRPYGRKGGLQEYWTGTEITEMFGPDAFEDIKKSGFRPLFKDVYSLEDIKAWQASRHPHEEKQTSRKYGLFVDPGKFEITYKDQGTLSLGNNIPFHLIARLAKRPNNYVDYEDLKRDVWKDEYTDDNTISRAVRKLRKILKDYGFTGIRLETNRNCARLVLL